MSSAAFDTHAAANRFKRAGFTDDQVEALVDVARDTTALPDVSSFATDARLDRVELALRADIERVELALRADIERVESSLRSEINRLELSTKAELEKLEARTDVKFARVEEKIVSAQVQTLAIMIPAVGLIVAVSKLFH